MTIAEIKKQLLNEWQLKEIENIKLDKALYFNKGYKGYRVNGTMIDTDYNQELTVIIDKNNDRICLVWNYDSLTEDMEYTRDIAGEYLDIEKIF